MSPGHGSGRRTGTETETPEAIIEVKELEKEFTVDGGSIEVIRSLSFSVLDGEILTVVGPSGCGKTTLLRLLGGFTRASRGEIRYRGQLLPAPDPSRVMMFQEFDQLFPWKSVASNVEFPMEAG
jgi:NitT/TauT family transport system ATP-binding protein